MRLHNGITMVGRTRWKEPPGRLRLTSAARLFRVWLVRRCSRLSCIFRLNSLTRPGGRRQEAREGRLPFLAPRPRAEHRNVNEVCSWEPSRPSCLQYTIRVCRGGVPARRGEPACHRIPHDAGLVLTGTVDDHIVCMFPGKDSPGIP
jgi:hypothetical protein